MYRIQTPERPRLNPRSKKFFQLQVMHLQIFNWHSFLITSPLLSHCPLSRISQNKNIIFLTYFKHFSFSFLQLLVAHIKNKVHSVPPPPLFLGGPNLHQIFKKGQRLTEPQFLEGDCRKEGVTFFSEGCNFQIINQNLEYLRIQ